MNKILPIKELVIDEELYPRDVVSDNTVQEYFFAMKKGDIFPLIEVAKYRNKQYYLIDGRHRIEAYKLKGEEHISCNIRNLGNKREIYLAAVRANLPHGKRFTTRDKVKIAGKLERFKVDISEISNMLNLKFKSVDKILVKQITKVKPFGVGRESISERGKPVDDATITLNEDELQVGELTTFLEYLRNEEFTLPKKKFKKLLMDIRKEINRLLK